MSLRRLRNVAGLLGTIIKWFGLVFLFPLLFALYFGTSLAPYLVPLALCLVGGFLVERRFPDTDLEMADGFLLVVLSWFLVSLVGALPYVLTGIGNIALPHNAFFESASGFTCTGSTILDEISLDRYPHALMMWRQLTQWLGGMGILVLAVAVLPRLSVGGAQFLDNEVPGPRMDRLTPHMAETARRLWLLYIGFTLLLFLLLWAVALLDLDPAMDAYQALAHTLSTIPSGGFSPFGASAGAFGPLVQWIIIPFMFVAAVNFALIWQAIFSSPWALFKDHEFIAYSGLFLSIGLLLSITLMSHGTFETMEASFRHGFFQMATFLTTTGFASTDFALWDGNSLILLVFLSFIAGCAGSTSGGLKVFRWIIAIKATLREMTQQIHPSSVRTLRLSNRVLKEPVIAGAMIVILVYFLLFGLSLIVLSIDLHLHGQSIPPEDLATAITATIGNIGPGFGTVGPMASFDFFPLFSKLWMCLLMIAGRLEFMSLLVIISPWYWKN